MSTKFYFCYSSALDLAAFNEWKESHGFTHFSLPEGVPATALGVAYVFDFPSRYWGGRVLSLEDLSHDSQPADVHGVLFEIHESHWPIVQHKEGVVTGASVEKRLKVLAGDASKRGGTRLVDALAFVTNPERSSQDGPVSTRFLETVLRAYETQGVPAGASESVRQAAGYPLSAN